MKLFQELPTSDTVEDAERKEAEWLAGRSVRTVYK